MSESLSQTLRRALALTMSLLASTGAIAGPNPFLGKTLAAQFTTVAHICDAKSCWDSDPIPEDLKFFVGKHGHALQFVHGAEGLILPLGEMRTYVIDAGPRKGNRFSYMIQMSRNGLVYVNYNHSMGYYKKYFFSTSGDDCNLNVDIEVRAPENSQYRDNIGQRFKVEVTQLTCHITEGAPSE